VAEEVGCKLGNLVGYTVRFDDTSSPNTRLKFVTDGTLLQEMLSDRLLSSYDIVIVDEAHERTLRTDMILGFLKQHQRARNLPDAQAKPDEPLRKLKVVVMSATLDAKRFSAFFDECGLS
jgi:HrpA-like RNA helicase